MKMTKILFSQLSFVAACSFALLHKTESFRSEGSVATDSNDGHLLTDHLQSSIVNGIPVINISQHKFFVSLQIANQAMSKCGGSIIARWWVLTAAHCVDQATASDVTIEEGDFSNLHSFRRMYYVSQVIVHEEYAWSYSPRFITSNDIALLKTTQPMDELNIIPLCFQSMDHGTELGTCGLGSTNNTNMVFPTKLMQTFFLENKYAPLAVFHMGLCPVHTVCTISFLQPGNICVFDDGSPLYTFKCGTIQPECLYGVAAYYLNSDLSKKEKCNAGSHFASVPHFHSWIQEKMNRF